MSNANFKLDGNTPTVTWADPKITPDNSAASTQVLNLTLELAVYLINYGQKAHWHFGV